MRSQRVGAVLLIFTGIGAVVGAFIGLLIGLFFPEFTIGLFGTSNAIALNPIRLSIGMGLANGAGFGCVGGMVAVVVEAITRKKGD